MTRYGVILADPAWRYANTGVNGSAAAEYESTMSLDEIKALPVASLAADIAVLLLWTTWPFLESAYAVARAWGFDDYVTGFPWIKIDCEPTADLFGETYLRPQWGTGWWVRGCSEPVLIFRRGGASPPRLNVVGLLSENFGHSRKPENLHAYAELLPGPYLELFARRLRPGWDVWGNEVDGSIVFGPVAISTDTSTAGAGRHGSAAAHEAGDAGGDRDRLW